MPKSSFLRSALVIWVGATLGAICVLPYVNALTPAFAEAATRLKTTVPIVILLSTIQSAVMLAMLTTSGLWAARKLGMGAPLIDAWLNGEPVGPKCPPRTVAMSAALGVGSGVLIVATDLFVFLPLSPNELGSLLRQPQKPTWMMLLASFEGGITEEVELRLFLLSLLALGLRYAVRGRADELLSSGIFWVANIVAAVLFGLGHLPTTSHLVALTPVIVIRAIVLNSMVGLVAGYLFWRRGIEMAMLCHFSADIVLHIVAPLLQPWVLGPS